jgi:hypothetical protein
VSGRHDVGVEWTQTATIIAALVTVMGAQAFWVSRALDALRIEMHRGFDALGNRMDRLENRMDRLENRMDSLEQRITRLEAGGPPNLRRA